MFSVSQSKHHSPEHVVVTHSAFSGGCGWATETREKFFFFLLFLLSLSSSQLLLYPRFLLLLQVPGRRRELSRLLRAAPLQRRVHAGSRNANRAAGFGEVAAAAGSVGAVWPQPAPGAAVNTGLPLASADPSSGGGAEEMGAAAPFLPRPSAQRRPLRPRAARAVRRAALPLFLRPSRLAGARHKTPAP